MKRRGRKPSGTDASSKWAGAQDRVWFPVTESVLGQLTVFNVMQIIDTATGQQETRDPHDSWLMAVKKSELLALFSDSRGYKIKEALHRITDLSSFAPGYGISPAMINSDWEFPDATTAAAVMRTLAKLVARIDYSNELPNCYFTFTQTKCLETGTGNCFALASTFASIIRKNGLAARITGNPQFFGKMANGGDHWWVEVFIEGEWKPYDLVVNQQFLGKAKTFVDSVVDGEDIETMHKTVASIISQAIANGYIISPILHEQYQRAVEQRIIAAEVNWPLER
jgi:hypothetical protein